MDSNQEVERMIKLIEMIENEEFNQDLITEKIEITQRDRETLRRDTYDPNNPNSKDVRTNQQVYDKFMNKTGKADASYQRAQAMVNQYFRQGKASIGNAPNEDFIEKATGALKVFKDEGVLPRVVDLDNISAWVWQLSGDMYTLPSSHPLNRHISIKVDADDNVTDINLVIPTTSNHLFNNVVRKLGTQFRGAYLTPNVQNKTVNIRIR